VVDIRGGYAWWYGKRAFGVLKLPFVGC
jgi:hypothetical protein